MRHNPLYSLSPRHRVTAEREHLFHQSKTRVSGSKSFYCKLFPLLQLTIFLVKLPPPRLQLLQHLILWLHGGQPRQRFCGNEHPNKSWRNGKTVHLWPGRGWPQPQNLCQLQCPDPPWKRQGCWRKIFENILTYYLFWRKKYWFWRKNILTLKTKLN